MLDYPNYADLFYLNVTPVYIIQISLIQSLILYRFYIGDLFFYHC